MGEKKALIIQHSEATPAGTTIEWLKQNHYPYHIYFFNSFAPVHVDDYELIFICGGGMNVDEENVYPWLVEEKKFIKESIEKNKKIIGLCLGAQLLAELMGGKVFRADHWEAGWHTVYINAEASLKVFQWHGYQFITPPGAVRLAHNEACPHQAFIYQNQILGFQFHPETTLEWINERANDSDQPPIGKYVQDKSELLYNQNLQLELKDWYFKKLNSFLL